MNPRDILYQLSKGMIDVEQAHRQLALFSIDMIGDNVAQLDIGRDSRKGVPEVIFGESKEYKDLVRISVGALAKKNYVIISRIQKVHLRRLVNFLKKKNFKVESGKKSTTILVSDKSFKFKMTGARIGIITAGTSDIGVAEEARLVATSMGCETLISYDIGIAGIHRLFPAVKRMIANDVGAIIVVAGMEGALASVISSLVDIPVIGVPTSVGYGFGSQGMAALASMLQSCTFGLAAVNIDNGIGAGAYAACIANRYSRKNDTGSQMVLSKESKKSKG